MIKLKSLLREGIDMRAVYAILKANNYGPEIKDGNRLTGIKSIDFGTYDKKTGRDGGRLSIDSNGELFGQGNWGMDIKDANELLDAIEQYRVDQDNK